MRLAVHEYTRTSDSCIRYPVGSLAGVTPRTFGVFYRVGLFLALFYLAVATVPTEAERLSIFFPVVFGDLLLSANVRGSLRGGIELPSPPRLVVLVLN